VVRRARQGESSTPGLTATAREIRSYGDPVLTFMARLTQQIQDYGRWRHGVDDIWAAAGVRLVRSPRTCRHAAPPAPRPGSRP